MFPDEALRAAILVDLNRELFEKTAAPAAGPALADPSLRNVWGVWDMAKSSWTVPGEPGAYNDLLSYWSILEVACVADVVPNPLPPAAVRFGHLLKTRFVLADCRRRQLALPVLLSRRVDNLSFSAAAERVDLRLFQWYLDLTMPFRDSQTVRAFTAIAGTAAGETAVPEIICNVDSDLTGLRFAGDRSDHAEAVRRGFVYFCSYCEELNDLLAESNEVPLFQAAIWHSHPDWAKDHAHLATAVRTTLERLAEPDASHTTAHVERLRLRSSNVLSALQPRARPVQWVLGEAFTAQRGWEYQRPYRTES